MEDEIANMLIKSGCYINTNKENKERIKLPDGNSVIAYLSCRLAISNIKLREKLENELSKKIKNEFDDDITIIGMATAGITWGHAIAQNLHLPMLYMRSSEKTYGLKGLIEGNTEYATKKVVIVDDTIHTGNTIHKAKEILKQYNMKLIGVACIAILTEDAINELYKENIKVISLTKYKSIIKEALKENVLNEEEYEIMKRIYENKN